MPRLVPRSVLVLLIVLVVLIVGGGIYARSQVRASLPQVDGTAAIAGLAANVRVDRDALGVPTITGAHARRRRSRARVPARAGSLLPDGSAAAPARRRVVRPGRPARDGRRSGDARASLPRRRASRAASAPSRRIGTSSTPMRTASMPDCKRSARRRSNTSCCAPRRSRGARKIRSSPCSRCSTRCKAGRPLFEQSHGALRDTLPEPMFRFLSTAGSEWDTPVVGSPIQRPPIPGAGRVRSPSTTAHGSTEARRHSVWTRTAKRRTVPCLRDSVLSVIEAEAASSAATTGRSMARTAHRARDSRQRHAPVDRRADHLVSRVDGVSRSARQPSTNQRITGVTLPGIPGLVVGSNGHVAWGFTNTGGDWSDLVRIEPDPRDPKKYLTPDGPKAVRCLRRNDRGEGRAGAGRCRSAGRSGDPIVWKDARGREYAQRWVAHDADALASDITKPERARTVDDLLMAVAGLGIPNQNVTMADATGRLRGRSAARCRSASATTA